MAEDAGPWLGKAEQDLHAARVNLEADLYDVAASLSQQAAGKALKAVYVERVGDGWKTHDLVAIGRQLEAPREIVDRYKSLSPHYFATRYPPEAGEDYERQDAETALEHATEVVGWSKDQL